MLNSFWDFVTGTNKQGPEATAVIVPYDYNQLYNALYELYNNDTAIIDGDTTRRLRTAVNRSVEFFAAKMLPGRQISVSTVKKSVVKNTVVVQPPQQIAPPNPNTLDTGASTNNPFPVPPPPAPDINQVQETENKPLKDALEQVIKDSNLGNNKPAMLRGFALYGDSFIRVRGDDKKSYLEDVSPFFVTDFGEDSRGFLTYIRIDIPILIDSNLETQTGNPALYTEYWDLETQTYRSWETMRTSTTPIAQLGPPKEEYAFSSIGVDFIPIVHTKFRDNGDVRGLSCVFHTLDKIYEANRIATRLHDLLFAFGEPIFVASANDKDAAGRPLPPPKVSTENATTAEESKETVFGRLISLPGVATLNALIPNIDYSDALAILNAQMLEIENDLPELRWYSMNPSAASTLSGIAVRALLGAAIDRANEARNNFISSLSRMLEMALTIGIFNNLFPATLGTFDSGDFKHEIIVDDAWGQSIDDKAATMTALTGAGIPAPAAMKMAGFTDIQITEAFPKGVQPPQPPPNFGQSQPGGIKTAKLTGKTVMVNGKPTIVVN